MLGITLGYFGRAHSNPMVVVSPSLVTMGMVNLKGIAEDLTGLVSELDRDTFTENIIQRCVKETAAMSDVEEGTDSLHENTYVCSPCIS